MKHDESSDESVKPIDVKRQRKRKCKKCGINAGTKRHPCPYDSDVNGCDDDVCNCCDECTRTCAYEI